MVPSDETQEGGNGEVVNEEVVTEDTAAATETDGVEDYVKPEDAPPADESAPADDAAAVDETLKEGADMGKSDDAPADGTFEDAPKEDLDTEAVEAGDDPANAKREDHVRAAAAMSDDDDEFDDEPEEVHPVLAMLKGLSDGTKSREEGRQFIDEFCPELND